MTSTDIVKGEIERFLKSTEPEVLCITGEWGVGKTYTWQTILDRLRRKREVGLSRYSYVSLFGIASLEAFKSTIFENLEFLVPEGTSGLDWVKSGGNAVLRHGKKVAGLAASTLPYVGNAIGGVQPLLFSGVRNQIVCIDDLERKGAISVKDVFGLISFLREQRGCKVVLLLNQTKLNESEESRKEFDDYFEKVIDTRLVFAPTATEAVAIAIDGKDKLSVLIAEHCVRLRISNIRVIKKIERMVGMIAPLVEEFDEAILRQVVHSVTMFGWCKLDTGAKPPPMRYVRQSSLGRYVDRKNSREAPSDDEKRWDAILGNYDWGHLDNLDVALLDFVESSVMDMSEIKKCAHENQEKLEQRVKVNSYEQAWRLFHDGFEDNAEAVCEALTKGFKDNFNVLSLRNLDEVVAVLRELEQGRLADDLIDFAEKEGDKDYWTSDDPFDNRIKDRRITAIVASRREAAKPKLDFEVDLVSAAENMNAAKTTELAKVPGEEYQRLFESRSGDQLRRLILASLDYRRIINASDDQRAIVEKAETALRNIGRRTKLNELRVRRYDVTIEDEV